METKLTSLDLHGYKTFARQTNLQFPARITAIVGPNGSGKSNVADSIRWVLGEQSYSLLRAKKTEDMIYSGSENRARSGMAAVSISFNNTSGWLPIDYAEVVLTRRAYRDGANEYLINGQRVRLKDFHELLAKTGLSDRTYTIIGQGLVDVALSIKPDERRMLFEEAAGIGLYRSRKEEALRRLEATERNLERAADIIDEIRPRMKNLEKQASRVGEFKLVQEDLKRNLKQWYGFHWYKALEEITKTRAQVEQYQAQLISQQDSTKAQEQISAGLLQSINQKRAEIDRLHTQIRQIHEDLQSRNQSMAILEERRKANADALAQLEKDLAHLEETIQAEEGQYASYKAELEKHDTDLTGLNAQHQAAQTKLGEARQAQGKLSRERADIQQQLVNLEKELVSMRSRKGDLGERLRETQNNQKNNLEAQSVLDEQLSKAKQVIDVQTALVQSLEAERGRLANARIEKQNKISEIRRTLDQNRSQVNRLNLEKNKLVNRLDLLKQGRESLAGFGEGARALMKTTSHGGPSSKMMDIATRLKVPEKYEKAVAAALGEAVDLLVVRGSAFDEHLLNDVSQAVNDRVAILPEKEVQPRQRAKVVEDKRLEGIASELVSCDEALRPVVELLLGDCLVVSDLGAALSLRRKASGWNFVTLEGETILEKGVAILGKSKSTSKVSYSRLVDELETSIAGLDDSLKGAAEIESKESQRLSTLEEGMNQLVQADRELAAKLERAGKELSAGQLSADKAQSQAKWIAQQAGHSQALVATITQQLKALDEKEALSTSRLDELNIALNEVRSKFNQLDLQTLEQQYQYLETERKMLSQSLAHSKAALQDLELRLNIDRTRQAQLNERKGMLEQASLDFSRQLEGVRNQIKTVQQADERQRRDELAVLEQELASLEQQFESQNMMDADHQKSISMIDRQIVHYQLELARQQEKMETLRARIEDDFGMIELENGKDNAFSAPLPFPDLVIEKLPKAQDLPEGIEEAIRQQKNQLRRIGSVNIEAEAEYQAVKERFESLTRQIQDLNAAILDLQKLIRELDQIMRTEFLQTFKAVSVEFSHMFSRLFNGGSARLILSDEEDPIEGGIEIEARLPGRREQGLVLLSGGERSLTAVALVFALLKISPTPFCVLDEVDAMLDESNVGRFIDLLRDLSTETQFLLITHNRNTVSAADVIYGVTMGKDSASQVISMKLDEVDEEYLK